MHKLESKVKVQEESLRKKNQREEQLLSEISLFEAKISLKQNEIEQLQKKMVLFETFKHKYDVKIKESEMLLHRVEELSQLNGDLQDQIDKKKSKTYKLAKEIDDLKDKLKIKRDDPPRIPTLNLKKIVVRGHQREESRTSFTSVVTPENDMDHTHAQDTSQQKLDSLQDELCMDELESPRRNNDLYQINTKPTLDEEEIFDGNNTLRTQYRFQTDEDDLES
jgi:hypothetical protein